MESLEGGRRGASPYPEKNGSTAQPQGVAQGLRSPVPGALDAGAALERELSESSLFIRHDSLKTWLPLIVFDGGRNLLSAEFRVAAITRLNGYSGFEYFGGGDLYAQLEIAPLQQGGFSVHRLIASQRGRLESWATYSENGDLQAIEERPTGSALAVEERVFEPRCPVLNHFYNYLAFEYARARTGVTRSRQVHFIECFLRRLMDQPTPLSAREASRDPAVRAIFARMTEVERDPVLNWEERQLALRNLRLERATIVQTKRRAHRLGSLRYQPALAALETAAFFHRLFLRPSSNLKGISYRYTLGVLFWFLRTVRGNIGYSIALAIYGPFTFYFITQPLNPHAMWAVGRVRSNYIEAVDKVRNLVSRVTPAAAPAVSPQNPAMPPAAAGGGSPPPSAPPLTRPAAGPGQAGLPGTLLGIPLSALSPGVESQPWSDRMSNFKAMQIGYEENLQFSARMGRLEQMETQLNFPLIVNSAWQEIDRYLSQLGGLHPARPELKAYLDSEEAGARRMQLYLWDRLYRFILDHPYVVMDQSREQMYRDYYFGHAFILLRELTMKLARIHPELKVPAEYKRVEKLALTFQKQHVDARGILERLSRNSRLFAQKDRLDGWELRSTMRRQWEILYLMQNKAQEAANFGLQMYTWSVRNTIWILQSLYSAKIRELAILTSSSDHRSSAEQRNREAARAEIRDSIEPLYESLFHLMSLEFASVKPEFSERLSNDLEARQRQVVIETTEQFLREREKILPILLEKHGTP